MIILLKKNTDDKKIKYLTGKLSALRLTTKLTEGENLNVLSVIGDTYGVDEESIKALDFVVGVKRVSEPFRLVSRKRNPKDVVIEIGDKKIGGGYFGVIAGPCSVESESQIISLAEKLSKIGVTALRGGAFKPRTSPYSFQGLGEVGVQLLVKAKKETGLKIVTEITDARQLDLFTDVDVLQVGARNMQNFELLKEVAKTNKPILLKRGLSSTVEEWLLAAEYVVSSGNKNVILCERGIKSFDSSSRASLDITSIPTVKELSNLPVIVDPSHASGNAKTVKPLALSAAAVGADGLMIEVHDEPSLALSDGAQAVTTKELSDIYKNVKKILPITGKTIN